MRATDIVTISDERPLKAFDAATSGDLVRPLGDGFEEAFRLARGVAERAAVSQRSAQLLTVLRRVRGVQCLPSTSASADPRPGGDARTPRPSQCLERITVEARGQVRVVPVAKVHHITSSGPHLEFFRRARPPDP